jgi:hypothetical protein
MTGYSPVTPAVPISGPFTSPIFPPGPNPFLRCPLPPVVVTPDSLRQFYRDGMIPQSRIITPSL